MFLVSLLAAPAAWSADDALAVALVLGLLGRSLNVISLAGMAFAVGMVVDNSIVVLENIYRHRQHGNSRFEGAY